MATTIAPEGIGLRCRTGGNQVRVTLRLPPGAALAAAHPPPAGRDGETLLYDLELTTDVELSAAWK
jgi:hypothetical protein